MPALDSYDGTRVVYDVDGEDDGRPPVVLLHGFASDAASNWHGTGIVATLVAAGHRVVTFDARGHGRSGKPHDVESYRPPAMARDVSALLDHLGAVTVDLVGYSMGSTTAITAASIEPRTRRLVLGGAGSTLLEAGSEAAQRRRQLGARVLEIDDPSAITDHAGMGLRSFVDADDGNDRLALAAVMRAEEGLTPEALRVTNRTLVIAGDRDVGAGDPSVLAAALADAEHRVVAGSHLSAVRNPAFASLVVEALA
jgi:pimeloyl-ACP methyl ester carboxylesterase